MKNLLIIGQLLCVTGPVDGRKKLQKIVHILQEGGVDFDFAYEFSYFGPYSAELKGSMDELVAAKLVDELPLSTGNGFRYAITETFSNLLAKISPEANPSWGPVAKLMNQREARELEGASTVLFLESRGWTGGDLEERFTSLKPHLKNEFPRLKDLAHELIQQLPVA